MNKSNSKDYCHVLEFNAEEHKAVTSATCETINKALEKTRLESLSHREGIIISGILMAVLHHDAETLLKILPTVDFGLQ